MKLRSRGYEIVRCFSFFSAVSTLASRFLENISFGLSVFFVLLFSPPRGCGLWQYLAHFCTGIVDTGLQAAGMPFVLSVQDLYPESLLVQKRGIEKTSWIYSLLHWLDTQTARNCCRLIVISEKFQEVYVNDRRNS